MLRDEVKQQLEETIIPYWTSLQDIKNGGFYGHVDFNLYIHKMLSRGVF